MTDTNTSDTKRTPDVTEWKEDLQAGFTRCAGCQSNVDLSDAETVNDAIQIWNRHVQEVHL